MYAFLLVIPRPYLTPFLRYGNLLAKIANFSHPSHLAPLLKVTTFKFMKKLYGS